MIAKSKIEFCTSSVEDAIKKASLVHQIEFCSNLEEDGLTPDISDLIVLRDKVNIPIKVMIRHRAGNFVYAEEELKLMIQQAEIFIAAGFDRMVFGASYLDNRLNVEQITQFCRSVYPAKICIHKAIDNSPDILSDLLSLMKIDNINEVLTSGGEATAMDGKIMLNRMVELSGKKMDIIAAGSIRKNNLEKHMAAIHTPIFHGRLIV